MVISLLILLLLKSLCSSTCVFLHVNLPFFTAVVFVFWCCQFNHGKPLLALLILCCSSSCFSFVVFLLFYCSSPLWQKRLICAINRCVYLLNTNWCCLVSGKKLTKTHNINKTCGFYAPSYLYKASAERTFHIKIILLNFYKSCNLIHFHVFIINILFWQFCCNYIYI